MNPKEKKFLSITFVLSVIGIILTAAICGTSIFYIVRQNNEIENLELEIQSLSNSPSDSEIAFLEEMLEWENPPVSAREYTAGIYSEFYHRISCSDARKIDEEEKLYFSSVSQPERWGKEPCEDCNPNP